MQHLALVQASWWSELGPALARMGKITQRERTEMPVYTFITAVVIDREWGLGNTVQFVSCETIEISPRPICAVRRSRSLLASSSCRIRCASRRSSVPRFW